jgi:hypothetical protein
MILTIAGANFSGANIGTNTNVGITLTKGNGVSGSKVSSLTLEKNKVVSTSTKIADLSLQTGYENLVVTVTMTGTGDVSSWFSNGTVTIPSGTKITGNIKITASATAISGGEEDEPVIPPVQPEEPGTGGNTMRFLVDYNIDSDGKIYQWPYNQGQGGGKEDNQGKVDCRIILLDYIETGGKDVSVDFSNITGIDKVALRYYDSSKNILTNYTSPVGSSYCRIILISDSKSTVNNYNNSTITINGIQYSLSDYAIKSIDENIVLFQPNGNIWSDGRNAWSSCKGRISIITYIPSNGSEITANFNEINSMLDVTIYSTVAVRYYNDSLEYMPSATNSKYGRCVFVTQDSTTTTNGLDADDCISKMVNKTITIKGKQYTLKDIKSL